MPVVKGPARARVHVDGKQRCRGRAILGGMEFANLLLIFVAAWLIWKRPEKENLAFRLLVICFLVTAFLYFVGTRTSILPRFNF